MSVSEIPETSATLIPMVLLREGIGEWGVNGLGLCEGGDFEVQMFILAQMFIRIPNAQI